MYENRPEQERALLVSVDTGEFDAEASIDELGKMMSTPLSRSAVSRRLKKLKDIKEEIDKR